MSQNTTREVISKMRERSARRGRKRRSRLLDELCELCGYGRKHAIKLRGGKLPVIGEKATLLRRQIPVRTEHWEVAGPGWIEADTVAHGGESMAGDLEVEGRRKSGSMIDH
jgi:hypothetical protein